MAVISATLDWYGVWEIKWDDIPSSIPDEEVIYMIICGKPSSESNKWDTSSYELLYIGEAKEVRSRIIGHEKWPRWKENCKSHILLKVAKCKLETTKRQKVECCLIYKSKPTCNDECKDDFPHTDDTIQITNKGMRSPLKDNYYC